MERSPEVVLCRHGESEWSRLGKYAGRVDVDLTPRGRSEMEIVGSRLSDRTFARVLVSPLQRAQDSCRLAGLSERAELRPELVEWDYGSHEGRTGSEVKEQHPDWSLWSDGAPGGETVEQVAARVDRVISELQVREEVAIFGHRDVLRVFGARWVGLPPEAGRLFSLATASISVLGYEGDTPSIISWNQTSHLLAMTAG